MTFRKSNGGFSAMYQRLIFQSGERADRKTLIDDIVSLNYDLLSVVPRYLARIEDGSLMRGSAYRERLSDPMKNEPRFASKGYQARTPSQNMESTVTKYRTDYGNNEKYIFSYF
ncbi:hypothetical protein GWI33_019886 [Rhynchophorus ferrugineus]|uniref:Uncharacterized protein n=1 Tax=Rhynchophorus ferrugineus TaxID=354439 RepID=A0A834M102_RHYFE|nr:hypothetical protein GWI33_019886 [Rhynchophorus ferrugineus]